MLAADITTGLAHHWTFDETSGNIAADSAGDADGTLVNWTATESKWEPGRIGGALRFDTADNYVTAQPPAMSGSFALSFWLNATNRDGRGARIVTPKAGNVVFINHESNRGVSYSQNDDFYTFSPESPTFNVWEHYVINFNNATGQGVIYRSGAPVAIGAFADSASALSWVIGHHSDLNNHDHSLHGALDDLRVYTRVLKDEDIALLASMGTPEPVHQEQVHHWTFNETTGFTAHDTAGGADGILLNWNTSEPRWEPGKVDGALRWSTADNAVVTPSVATGAQWSIAFWLNLTARTGINPRIRESWATINLENNRGVGFTTIFEPTPFPLGTWNHYSITFDTVLDVGTIYRNGVAVQSGPFAYNAPATPLVFGHHGDTSNHNDTLNGLLDDFRIYDRLLTLSEIGALAEVPTAEADSFTVNEDTTLQIPAPGVLENDSHSLAGSLTAVREAGPSHGSLTLNADGSFRYTPTGDYNGPDSFTYRATSGAATTDIATVTISVLPVNDPPSFMKGPDLLATDERLPVSGASTITFDGLNGPPNALFQTAYSEAGFKVTPITGRWIEAHDPSHITGHPAPAIYGDTYNSSLEVTRTSAAPFTFAGFDLASWEFDFPAIDPVSYTVVGLLNGQTVFSKSGEVATSDFETVASPSNAVIDRLRFSMVRLESQAYIIDNIRVAISEPVPSISGWATNLSTGPANEAGQGLTFVVNTDNPDLFAVRPRILSTGTLTFTPAPNASGTATVTVVLKDNGGVASGGSDSSPPQTFKINITKPHPRTNVNNPLDASADAITSAIDALVVVNYLNSGKPGQIPPDAVNGPPYYDTSGDNFVSAIDALHVFNSLNSGATLYGPLPYYSADDSPFNLSGAWLETFEDGLLNTPGVTTINGSVRGPTSLTDSVDADDGPIDGNGNQGHSYLVRPGSLGVTFVFDSLVLGGLPTDVGIVVTGSSPNSRVEFFNSSNSLIATVFDPVEEFGPNTTDGDRFIGISHNGGIRKIRVVNDGVGNQGLEVDHLQYGGGIQAPTPASAAFIGVDAATQGDWQTKYGADGYSLNSGPASLPAYAQMSFTGGLTAVYSSLWADSTNDLRALQLPGSTERRAAAWTGDYGFTLHLNLVGGQAHRVALYVFDWEPAGRSQRVDVVDASTGGLLDSQTIEIRDGVGRYLVWSLRGHVQIRIIPLARNAVVSGVFFD